MLLLIARRLPLVVPPLLWHAHEMLFGFAVAVIVGFLLTAGKAWTGLATPRGAFLGALAALWLGGPHRGGHRALRAVCACSTSCCCRWWPL
jgi:uncharacterized protein involved in response to NO